MAKQKQCCGRRFRNESALHQHWTDKHPGRPMKTEQPSRKRGFTRQFLVTFAAVIAGMLTVQAFYQYGTSMVSGATAQAAVLKASLVARR